MTWTRSTPLMRFFVRETIQRVTDMSTEANVAAVTTQLPLFWPANPQVWFIQVEAQFSGRGITASKTKYEDIVCALPTEYATKVQDLLLDNHLSKDNPYERLKDQLMSRIADSECQKIRQLLMTEELGDRKPTQLLCKIQQLLGGRTPIDSSLLRELFYNGSRLMCR